MLILRRVLIFVPMRGICLTAALSIAVPGAAAWAQPDVERYRDAVRAYQHGDGEGAAGTLIAWSRRDLERVIRLMLTFYPQGVAPSGWHDLKVTLKRGRGDVTARPGYFAAP